MSNLLLAIFLAAHGVIHLGYVTPAPADPKYPFSLAKSWLTTSVGIQEPLVHAFGILLTVVTVAGFALAGLATAGIIVPQSWWQPLIVVSVVASFLLLVFFWHSWLIVGLAIDVVLVFALIWLGWSPFSAAGV